MEDQRIKMSHVFLKQQLGANGWVAFARHNDSKQLVAHVLAIREDVSNFGRITWVTQLVTHCEHRRLKIATQLLCGLWGFSEHAAWGLCTSRYANVLCFFVNSLQVHILFEHWKEQQKERVI